VQQVQQRHRFFRLINEAIQRMELDLRGLTVLTEAASASFICTSLLAARAGANVVAVTQSSRYGSSKDVITYGCDISKAFGLSSAIHFTDDSPLKFVKKADLVTNLGFVRPINEEFVALMPQHAVISLMWAPWEVREEDIAFNACKDREIPVIGTNEHHEFLQTFEYVGMTALKLLLESGIEVFGSKVGLVGSDPFGSSIALRLQMCGAIVERFELPINHKIVEARLGELDAFVVAEHRNWTRVIGGNEGISAKLLKKHDISLIHICGNIDTDSLNQWRINKFPPQVVSKGYMTVTTSYVGPKPSVDLHCAGLRIGADAVRCRIDGGTVEEAIICAENSGLGLRLPGWIVD
jgi:hypothetical protein